MYIFFKFILATLDVQRNMYDLQIEGFNGADLG